MIIFFSVVLKDLFKLKHSYPWPRPKLCPRCKASGVWGHGYVTACFDGFDTPLILRRYRCPCCGCIIRLRPKGYFSRFQAPIDVIRSNLSIRIETGRWSPGGSHSRKGHWLRSLRRRVAAYLGNAWSRRLMEAFDHFINRGIIPVSRSI